MSYSASRHDADDSLDSLNLADAAGSDAADSGFYDESKEPTFAELGVPGAIVRALADDGKRTAFPIQADTLPDSLAGRDILGRGRTGSGKTLAFSIPLVARLSGGDSTDAAVRDAQREIERRRHSGNGRGDRILPHPRGLVLAPTRELANQIDEVIAPLAQAVGLSTTTVYGGVRYARQIAELEAGADIVVACPGRLEDLLRQGALSLESVSVAVLDEADEMADMGFLPAVERLLFQIDGDAQIMLFSATLDHGVDKLVGEFLEDPKEHSVDEATTPVDEMTHHVFAVTRGDKPAIVRTLASGEGKRILFTRTKFQAKKLAASLTKQGIPCAELHGNLNQNQRDRNLAAFEDGDVNVMAATDVAARGIDVGGVELVVHVEPPADPKSFLHRSGRTARAGHSGDVVTVMLPEQRRETMTMLHRAGLRIKPTPVRADSEEVLDLVGTPAEKVEGWELAPLKRKPLAGKAGKKGGKGAKADRAGKGPKASGPGRGRDERRDDEPRRSRRDGHRGDRFADGRWSDEPAEFIEEPRKGGKRVHRKPMRIVRDERTEDARRQERRMKAKAGKGRRDDVRDRFDRGFDEHDFGGRGFDDRDREYGRGRGFDRGDRDQRRGHDRGDVRDYARRDDRGFEGRGFDDERVYGGPRRDGHKSAPKAGKKPMRKRDGARRGNPFSSASKSGGRAFGGSRGHGNGRGRGRGGRGRW